MAITKPHTKEEEHFRAAGYKTVAGADEAGKGSWAGPLVAAAVVLPPNFEPLDVNDSKQLTPAQRERLFVHITKHALAWAVAVISPREIDQKGIAAANKKALYTAIKKLRVKPQAILVDAVPLTVANKPVKAIIKGDAKVLSIAAASIIAKVTRDALMVGHHRLFPGYGFDEHKGYGTANHAQQLKKLGPCPIHRRSFRPVRLMRLTASV